MFIQAVVQVDKKDYFYIFDYHDVKAKNKSPFSRGRR